MPLLSRLRRLINTFIRCLAKPLMPRKEERVGTPKEGRQDILTITSGVADRRSSKSLISGSEPNCPGCRIAPAADDAGPHPGDDAPKGGVSQDVQTIQPPNLAQAQRPADSDCDSSSRSRPPYSRSSRPISAQDFTDHSHPNQIATTKTPTRPSYLSPPLPPLPLLPSASNLAKTQPLPDQPSTTNPSSTTSTGCNTMSEGVKEKGPREPHSLHLGVAQSATSISPRHQVMGQAPDHDDDDDDDDVDPFTTPQAQRTTSFPFGHRPVTRSQTKRLRLGTSGTSNTAFAWDRAGDNDVRHPLTGGLRLPGSSFSFRVGTSISAPSEADYNQPMGDEEYDSISIDASGPLAVKRKRSSTAEESTQDGSRGTKVPLRAVPFVQRENLRDKTYRPSYSRLDARMRGGAHKAGSRAPRRSLRLQLITPATSMERVFPSLPPELQVAFWQTAASYLAPSLRRVVYLRNTVSRIYTPGALNPLPPLFHVSVEARKAIMKHYRKLFAHIIPAASGDDSSLRRLISAASVVDSASSVRPGVDPKLFPPAPTPSAGTASATMYNGRFHNTVNPRPGYVPLPNSGAANRLAAGILNDAARRSESLDFSSYQFVNPDSDIIAFEPCCSGCRAYHCARKQFRDDDRAAVRFLALRNESEHLAASTRPAWATMTAAWPNVETLYLITNLAGPGAVNWNRRGGEWALLRVEKEGPHEEQLRQRFDQWKANEEPSGGKASKVSTLEFVVLVPRERKFAVGISVGGLYSSPERMVADEDVIVG